MDLRIERTNRSIINAFIELRSKKPLEKITIKELSELAYINKATFYSHYCDIYDLSEKLETETLDHIIATIPHPEELVTQPKEATQILAVAFLSQQNLIKTLFSDSRSAVFVNRLESRLKKKIFEIYPDKKDNLEFNIALTYLIQGCFHVFLSNFETVEQQKLVDMVGTLNEQMLTALSPKA